MYRPMIRSRSQLRWRESHKLKLDVQRSTTGQAARGIGGSWAGGDRGMEVTSNVLEQVPVS